VSLFLQLLVNGIVNGVMYALMAVAFGLVYRSTGVFHLAQAAIYLVAAYAMQFLIAQGSWALAPAFVVAVAIGASCSLLVELLVYLPITKRSNSGNVCMIASLGIYVVMKNLLAILVGTETKLIDARQLVGAKIGVVKLGGAQLGGLITGIIVLALVALAFKKFRTMRLIWALGDRPELLAVLGYSRRRLHLIVALLSGVLVSIAACVYALDIGVSPPMGMGYFLIAVVGVVVGGVSRWEGWVAGAVLLGVVHGVAGWALSLKWMESATFIVLIVALMFRPQGLVSRRLRAEEMET
jgi:branched-subunit amino acid ABC-type transport system permease component